MGAISGWARMRPRAAASETRSRSGNATVRSPMSRNASAPLSSSPPKAKQSSLSCAISVLHLGGMRQYQLGNPRNVAHVEAGHRKAVHWYVGDDGDHRRVLAAEQRLPEGRAMHLELRMRMALEPLDEHEIDSRHVAQQLRQSRLGSAPMLAHQRPAPLGRDHDFDRARLAVAIAVLARLVHVEGMVRMLHGGDRNAAPRQLRNEAQHERGLAAAAPAREAEHPHGPTVHAMRRGSADGEAGGSTGTSMWLSPAWR